MYSATLKRDAKAEAMNDRVKALAKSEEAAEAPVATHRALPPVAQRALAEAEARRAKVSPDAPPELNGRGGRDPVRYGDWEVKGLASDF